MFSFKRFSEQFKIILMQNAQRQGQFLAIISLVFIFSHYMMFYRGGNQLSFNFEFMGLITAIMTLINSTGVFSALLRTDSAIHYYMTPGSIGEKYTAAWLYSSIFTVVIYTSVISLVHLVSMNVGNAITGRALPYEFPGINTIKEGFLSIMFFQSLFFLGAVVFKKNPFGKTLLTIIFSSFVIGLLGSVLFTTYIKGSDWMSSSNTINFTWNGNMDTLNEASFPKNLRDLWYTLKITVYAIPFICWIAAYLRLKTREV